MYNILTRDIVKKTEGKTYEQNYSNNYDDGVNNDDWPYVGIKQIHSGLREW